MTSIETKPVHVFPMTNPTVREPAITTPVVPQVKDTMDFSVVSRKHVWDAAGVGAAASGMASAAAYHLPRFASFARLTPALQSLSVVGLGATAGLATHTFMSTYRGGQYQTAAWPAALAVGGAVAGLMAASSPAFVGLSVLGQLTAWAAITVGGGIINGMASQDSKATASAATGAAWGAVAAPNLINPLTPWVLAAAAVVGIGLGAVHHKILSSENNGAAVHQPTVAPAMPADLHTHLD